MTATESEADATSTDENAQVTDAAVDAESSESTESTATAADAEGALGDAGKKALDAMKAERKIAREEAAAAKAELAALRAKLDGKEAEYAAEQQKAAARTEALQGANERILRSEIRSAAKGVLADPADAFKFLDLSNFTVGDDGEVDEGEINAELQKLVEAKPYLAVQDGKRFQGAADGGPKGTAGKPQVTEAQLKTMTPEQIVKAQNEGRLAKLLEG